MNIVRELRIKKGVQQKELALELNVSSAAVSNWENGKSDPSGDRLKKLSDYFGVDESAILGYGSDTKNGQSETEKIVQYVLNKINNIKSQYPTAPKTPEAILLAKGVDKMPKEQREQAVRIFRAIFEKYSNYFDGEGEQKNGT